MIKINNNSNANKCIFSIQQLYIHHTLNDNINKCVKLMVFNFEFSFLFFLNNLNSIFLLVLLKKK